MQTTLKINQTSRNTISKFFENYSLEQLNAIPEGFSNNLIWNIGHVVVVQQMLIYKLSGLPMMISDGMVVKYMRGTKPEGPVSQEEADEIKALLFSTVEKAEKDFANEIFNDYQEFTTMSGYTVRNAQEAMTFNNYHEGVHTGIMMQIKKFV